MLIASNEHTVWAVAKDSPIYQNWPILGFQQIFGVNSMLPVSSIKSPGRIIRTKIAALELLAVCLCCEVPNSRRWINYPGRSDANQGVNIDTVCMLPD
jgi:hypothetical protein